jgi:hypothetical protein
MSKNVAILGLISAIILMSNTLLAQDDDDDPVAEVSEMVNLSDKYFVSGQDISYVEGYVEGMDSGCKWWHWCWYWYKPISNLWVYLYIRASNGEGGEFWTKVGKSQTDQNGYYSFSNVKNYCGPVQVKVPALEHLPAVDYGRDCGLLDKGRKLDIVGKF